MATIIVLMTFVLGLDGDSLLPCDSGSKGNMTAYSMQFFTEDISVATASFELAMQNSKEFDELAVFLHTHPEKYAALMYELEKQRKNRKAFRLNRPSADRYSKWTEYLHRKTNESRAFAIKSAIGWRKGWGLSSKQVVSKLNTKSYPSTRRIAIEFLKRENNGDDLGFEWRKEADSKQNRAAIQKWIAWLEQEQLAQ